MKKTILFSIITLTLFSCGSNDTITISKKEYKRLIGDTITSTYPKPFKIMFDDEIDWDGNGIVLGSDGHEYLLIYKLNDRCNIEHYIDCVKCIERTKKRDSLK
jgi:hypothetical protein